MIEAMRRVRDRIAATARCVIMLTASVMIGLQRLAESHEPALASVAVPSGVAVYVAATTFPWAFRSGRKQLDTGLVAMDVLVVSALLWLTGGLSSEYYVLYYLPVLHASLRLELKEAVTSSVLAGVCYSFIGLATVPEGQMLAVSGIRIGTVAASGIFLAVFFARTAGDSGAGDVQITKLRDTALRESEQRFRDVLEASVDVIYKLKVGTGTYDYISPAAEQLFGFRPEELSAVGFDGFYRRTHPEDRQLLKLHFDNLLNHSAEEGMTPKIYYRWRCRDGEYRWFSDHRVLIREDSRPLALVGTIRDVTQRRQMEGELQRSFQRLRRTLEGTVNALAATAEKKDPYTAGHQKRVAQLACAIAKEMGFSEEQIEGIRLAAVLHDIGKLHIPAEILSKPGGLSGPEAELIKSHPEIGYQILRGIPFEQPVAQVVQQHHERLDGSGYPSGLGKQGILLEARILAVADAVEAISAHRPFRPALGVNQALEEIEQGKGSLYDPDVVHACLNLFARGGRAARASGSGVGETDAVVPEISSMQEIPTRGSRLGG